MIEALIDGERRPAVLADLAKGKMRSKIPDLTLALEGRFGDHHALMCRLHLDRIDHLDAMLDAQIETMTAPFQAARDLLTTTPGIGPLAAAVIAEIGADVTDSSLTRRTWPPGPGSARAATNPPGNATPANPAMATSTSSRSWWNAPGPPPATTATSRPSTTGTS